MHAFAPPVPLTYKRNHPATEPHVFQLNSKSVQSTIDALDRTTRENWRARDPSLSRKARRLRGTYGTSDIINHPELRHRVVKSRENRSRVQEMLSRNKSIVTNDWGFFPSGRRKDRARNSDVSSKHFAIALNSNRANCSSNEKAKCTSMNKSPFYSPGKGEGPLFSLSLDARYGAVTSAGGHAAHQDNKLFFDEKMHASIDVVDDPMTGTTLSWPSLGGGEHMMNTGKLYSPYTSRIDEFGKVSPCQWPDTANYTKGSAISGNESESPIVIPRGVARSMEREGIRESRVHKIALTKRREETKRFGRWLQGKSVEKPSAPLEAILPCSSVGSSFHTEHNPSMVTEFSTKLKGSRNNSLSEFDSRLASYGELASTHLSLTGGPQNPFRRSMSKSSNISVKFAGSYSIAHSDTQSHARKSLKNEEKDRNHLVLAIAKATKSLELENVSKINVLAHFGLLLLKPPNNCPGHEVVLKLSRALVDTASSNPNPEIVARGQFIKVIMSQLDHVSIEDTHKLYSTFDSKGRGEVSHIEFCCSLLTVHRPSMNMLTSGHYSYARQYLESIPVLDRCIELFDNGRGGITKHDLRSIMKSCSLTAEDRATMEVHVDQVFKLLAMPFDKFATPKIIPKVAFIGREGILIKNGFVLNEFQRQLLHLQRLVLEKQEIIKQ